MTRILRSTTKKIQSNEDLSSKLSISKKSKVVKRKDKIVTKANNEAGQQSGIWNINSILSNIFAYADHKGLVEFNTVCKKWNHLTYPIIHKKIKLIRNLKQIHGNNDKIDAEVAECISNNEKHAHLVNELSFNCNLEPRRAVEVFETFRFISILSIINCNMSQGQFLSMINSLSQLQELTLSYLRVNNDFRERLYEKTVQLPSSLKKLRLRDIGLINSPRLFVQTINSHSNLVEFFIKPDSNQVLLEPFYKHYPSLLNFEFNNRVHESSQLLIKIFEYNSQLITLKLTIIDWSKELSSYISCNLTSLEELNLSEYEYNYRTLPCLLSEFPQPNKIKKLSLGRGKYGENLLNSIFLNCSHLEDLTLNQFTYYNRSNSESSINLSKSTKIKKLNINCENFKISVLSSILINCPQLNELVINLPLEWKEALKSIYEMCSNLKRLEISPPLAMYQQARSTFSRELRNTEFFTSSPKFKSSLSHLTLNHFTTRGSKAVLFKYFENLKSIKFPAQKYIKYQKPQMKTNVNMNLWPGYELIMQDNKFDYDIEFKKILN